MYLLDNAFSIRLSIANLGWPGEYAGAITPVLADMNEDGRLDFAFLVFQGQTPENMGSVTDGPTLNHLFLYVSNPDGSYSDRSSEFLGDTSSQTLPGMARKVSVFDLNQDGKLDWVYALNREDGRSGSPAENTITQAAAVISQADGTYQTVEFGASNWYHSVYVDHYLSEAPTVILSGYNSGPSYGSNDEGYILGGGYGYRWNTSNQAFSDPIPYPAHPNTAVSLETSDGKIAFISVVDSPNSGEGAFLGLFRQYGSTWRNVDQLVPYESASVNFVSWSQDRGSAALYQIEPGVYGTAGGYPESRKIALHPGDQATAVFKFAAAVVTTPRSDGYFYENDGTAYQKLDFYRVSGNELNKLAITVLGEDREINGNFLDVVDFNQDGLEDVVVYPYDNGGQPRVYLNTGGDKFVMVDKSIFPEAPSSWGGAASSKFSDINGDGILDLFYAPMNGFSLTNTSQLNWLTYLGDEVYDASKISTSVAITDRLGSGKIITWGGDDSLSDSGAASGISDIDLGQGIDRISYALNRSVADITTNTSSNGYTVKLPGFTDQFINVERIEFLDQKIAIDIDGNAGQTAKILGAVFGKEAVSNKEYAGIGLHFLDSGVSYEALMDLALNAALGDDANDHVSVVKLLYKNVLNVDATDSDAEPFIQLLEDGMTKGALGVMAAETTFNAENIGLVGLQETGLAYELFAG